MTQLFVWETLKTSVCWNFTANSLHNGSLLRCCKSRTSLSQDKRASMEWAWRVTFRIVPRCSCQIPQDRSSPSTVSFKSTSLSCTSRKIQKQLILMKSCNNYQESFVQRYFNTMILWSPDLQCQPLLRIKPWTPGPVRHHCNTIPPTIQLSIKKTK